MGQKYKEDTEHDSLDIIQVVLDCRRSGTRSQIPTLQSLAATVRGEAQETYDYPSKTDLSWASLAPARRTSAR